MSSKLYLIALLLVTPSAYACFSDSGCPRNNICVKTGNLIGICLSIYAPYGPTATPSYGYAPGVVNSTTTRTQVPSLPVNASTPVLGGTCSSNLNCQAGFVCSRPNYSLVGVCTQVNPQ